MIEFHNPVMKMIDSELVLLEIHVGNKKQFYKKQKDNVLSTFIFSLHRFDQKLPNRVILLKMD